MRVRELSQNILHRIARLSLIRVRWTFVIPATVIVGSIVIVGLVWGSEVSALSAEAIGNTLLRVIARFLFFMTTMIISLTVFFLKFFILLAGYNGFSTAPAVELGWTLIRDIANMIFIIALLVIAFATILGREDYALKKTLGKLLLMAIFINFSKLIAQLIIDAAHVVTMTFLNALSAVAGGNLIQMFKFREIMSMNTTDSDSSDFLLKLVGAGIMGVSMTFMAFCILGAYFIIMLYRMVALWILIILSPIAYAAAALPSTASVAQNWWKEFTDNVIAAPIMVFFMWLAFASMANSASLHHVAERNSLTETTGVTEFVSSEASSIAGSTEGTQQPPVSLSDGTTWENMASFAIAIGFLFVGIERVQKLGVKGAGALNKAKDIGIKGGMVLSGLAATRWAGKRIASGTKDWAMDNSKILAHKTGASRMWMIGSDRKGLAKRKAALATAQGYTKDKNETAIARDPKNRVFGIIPVNVSEKAIEKMRMDKDMAQDEQKNRQAAIKQSILVEEKAKAKAKADSVNKAYDKKIAKAERGIDKDKQWAEKDENYDPIRQQVILEIDTQFDEEIKRIDQKVADERDALQKKIDSSSGIAKLRAQEDLIAFNQEQARGGSRETQEQKLAAEHRRDAAKSDYEALADEVERRFKAEKKAEARAEIDTKREKALTEVTKPGTYTAVLRRREQMQEDTEMIDAKSKDLVRVAHGKSAIHEDRLKRRWINEEKKNLEGLSTGALVKSAVDTHKKMIDAMKAGNKKLADDLYTQVMLHRSVANASGDSMDVDEALGTAGGFKKEDFKVGDYDSAIARELAIAGGRRKEELQALLNGGALHAGQDYQLSTAKARRDGDITSTGLYKESDDGTAVNLMDRATFEKRVVEKSEKIQIVNLPSITGLVDKSALQQESSTTTVAVNILQNILRTLQGNVTPSTVTQKELQDYFTAMDKKIKAEVFKGLSESNIEALKKKMKIEP